MSIKLPPLSIVVAMDENRLIGNKNKIPWHIPGELKRFREITMGKPIVMGRKTHESIGRVLDGRQNIVLSSNLSYKKEGVTVYHDFFDIINDLSGHDEVMIIGGSEIYKIALPYTSKLYITHINKKYSGDTWFPEIDYSKWKIINSQDFINSNISTQYTIKTYLKVNV
ncbi:dihydrofolate reductase [Gammaproteobacteria bacterium]|nr:dihydrofolate reductase [Gammaproteobacteria bacterium]